MIQENSRLWNYLSSPQRVLAQDGQFLLDDSQHHQDEEPTDYSYIVFPFAKLYEGFLKQLFLDLGLMSERDYISDHYRIGRSLSPHLVRRLGEKSAYGQIEKRFGKSLSTRLWHTWKNGRNLIFHYFPHNFRCLSLDQAKTLIQLITDTMAEAVAETNPRHESPLALA